jgi:DUF971 family protein
MEAAHRAGGRGDIPREVRRVSEAQVLRITWRDGHESEYPFAYLRGWCPCAACQGHGNENRYVHGGSAELVRVGVVGNYALSFVWGDGHDTGIYAYRYLRELCACAACHPSGRAE